LTVTHGWVYNGLTVALTHIQGEYIMATDITMHNDAELADVFDNDEYLYEQARMATSFADLQSLADEYFIYTPPQLDELKGDYIDGRWDDEDE